MRMMLRMMLHVQVNEYPTERSFKAIGSGGDDFVASMISAVENAVGTVKPSRVQHRPSAKGGAAPPIYYIYI
jgi:putative lipoic acid-binding regulatory protein